MTEIILQACIVKMTKLSSQQEFSFISKPQQISHLHLLQFFYVLLRADSGSQGKVTLFRFTCLWPDFAPAVTSMALNLEPLKSLVKSGSTVTSVHSSSAVHPG